MNFFSNIGPTEFAIIVVILIVLFGAKLVTNLARTSGASVREIKNIKKEFTKAVEGEDSK